MAIAHIKVVLCTTTYYHADSSSDEGYKTTEHWCGGSYSDRRNAGMMFWYVDGNIDRKLSYGCSALTIRLS